MFVVSTEEIILVETATRLWILLWFRMEVESSWEEKGHGFRCNERGTMNGPTLSPVNTTMKIIIIATAAGRMEKGFAVEEDVRWQGLFLFAEDLPLCLGLECGGRSSAIGPWSESGALMGECLKRGHRPSVGAPWNA